MLLETAEVTKTMGDLLERERPGFGRSSRLSLVLGLNLSPFAPAAEQEPHAFSIFFGAYPVTSTAGVFFADKFLF